MKMTILLGNGKRGTVNLVSSSIIVEDFKANICKKLKIDANQFKLKIDFLNNEIELLAVDIVEKTIEPKAERKKEPKVKSNSSIKKITIISNSDSIEGFTFNFMNEIYVAFKTQEIDHFSKEKKTVTSIKVLSEIGKTANLKHSIWETSLDGRATVKDVINFVVSRDIPSLDDIFLAKVSKVISSSYKTATSKIGNERDFHLLPLDYKKVNYPDWEYAIELTVLNKKVILIYDGHGIMQLVRKASNQRWQVLSGYKDEPFKDFCSFADSLIASHEQFKRESKALNEG